MCEQYELYILNGIHNPAVYTCHTSRGNSTVDFILCNKQTLKIHTETSKTYQLSDHDLIYTYIPFNAEKIQNRVPKNTTDPTTPPTTSPTTDPATAEQQPSTGIPIPPEDKHEDAEDSRERHYWIEGECIA
jgi:hypothetical protein